MGKVGGIIVDVADSNTVMGYILDYIRSNCSIPEGFDLLFDTLSDDSCIGIFPKSNAEVVESYVTGGYLAQFPFYVCIKSKPVTDVERLGLYDFYSGVSRSFKNLSNKLSDCNSTFEVSLSDGIYLVDIKSVSNPAVVQRNDDGSEVLQALYNLQYERS